MNIKDFSQPTILKGTQYGTTITIEIDHSDTSIDEVMDGFLTIVKGLGYLDTTVNQWIKDKSTDIYDDEYDVISKSLTDDWFDESNGEDYPGQFKDWSNETPTEEDLPTECWCGDRDRCDCVSEPNDNDEYEDFIDSNWDEERIDIIGQNGNEGTHYGLATDEDMEECELNEKQLKDYKGVYVEKPHFDWDSGIEESIDDEFDDYGMRKTKPKKTKSK
jgi:hypothetical protein